MSKNVKSLTNREQLEKMEKMERKLQEFELQNNAVQVKKDIPYSLKLVLNIFMSVIIAHHLIFIEKIYVWLT